MIYVKNKIRDFASNQSDLDNLADLSKSALDRSSRSILDEYQQKFEDNQAILQGYVDVLKGMSDKIASVGENVKKQYEWLSKQDFIPTTEGGQEKLDEIKEQLCSTTGDDGNGNPGCNVTIEQISDLSECISTGDDSGCNNTCDSHFQMCDETWEGSCQTACEQTSQTTNECPTICDKETQSNPCPTVCDQDVQTCDLLADKCPTLEDVLRECGQCLGVCVGPGEQCSELCDAIGDTSCTSYGQDNWCGLLESTCEYTVDILDCVTLGDYSGDTCYAEGQDNCSRPGQKYCTDAGEQHCNYTGEYFCLFPGESHCLFEGEDSNYCETITDEYMCQSSGDGPNTCHQPGEAYCYENGETYCHEPGEKFYCFFVKDDICVSLADQLANCESIDDTWVMCQPVVVDACGIPFKDCMNSAVCPPEYGQNAGCGEYEGCGFCQTNCLSCGLDAGPCQACGLDGGACQSCGLGGFPCQTCGQDGFCQNCEGGCTTCDGVCIDTCDDCQGPCDNPLISPPCSSTCNNPCITLCDSICIMLCDATCDYNPCQTCQGSCVDTCDGCTTNCESGCTSRCQNCEGACTVCDSYCETHCERCEDTTCHDGCTSTSQCCEGCTGQCQGTCVSSCVAGTHCDPYVWVCTDPSE